MTWDTVSSLIARLLASYPYQSIFASLLLCFGLSAGLINIRLEQDIRNAFSPPDSESGYETRKYLDFYNFSTYPERAFCIFTAQNDDNVLSKENIKKILSIDEIMTQSIRHNDSSGRRNCEPMCNLNRPFHFLVDKLTNRTNIKLKDSEVRIGFPDLQIDGNKVFLGLHLSNVTVDESNVNEPIVAKTLILWYFSRSEDPEAKKIFKTTVLDLFDKSQRMDHLGELNFNIFSDQIANKEMIRGAIEATTLMTIGFFLLLTFVIIVVARLTPWKRVPCLVAVTLLTPIAATISSFGFICWLGLPSFSIQCVCPFLVLGIGVDDAFILIHRWKHHRTIKEKTKRLEQVIVDVGPSITITSLTNVIAFGIGVFTPTPQMALFCLSASVALLLDYIFTYTILAPVIFLCRDEESDQGEEDDIAEPKAFEEAIRKYSKFLCSTKGRLFCGAVLIALYSFTTYGVYTMKATFAPPKAFPSNSRLVDSLNAIAPVFNVYFPINVFVNKPPNISDPVEHQNFYDLVKELEQTPAVYGDNRTLLFLPTYEKFDQKVSTMLDLFNTGYTPSYDNLHFWLQQIGNPPLAKFTYGNGTNPKLEAFRFTLLGKGMSEWADRALVMQRVRTILKSKSQTFNATLFDGDAAILNIILTVGQDLIGSIAVTVVCMVLMCLIFVANLNAVMIITSMIGSICLALVGCLSWWGLDLDPITQVDVLLATGFSVDFTAHVAYQYFRAGGRPVDRVFSSLAEMAEPMIEAGMSTFLCMLPLIFVPTYAIVAFAKTIFLIVGIGLLHGLFILPVVLAMFTKDTEEQKENTKTIFEQSQVPLVDKSQLQAIE